MRIVGPFSELGSPGAQGELAAECHRALCVASQVPGKLEEALLFSLCSDSLPAKVFPKTVRPCDLDLTDQTQVPGC